MRWFLQLMALLLPIATYVLYVTVTERRRLSDPAWREAPWAWLTAAGLAMLIGSFLALGIKPDTPIGGTYVPPHEEDGKLVPGQVRK
jgi:hypothetical protein